MCGLPGVVASIIEFDGRFVQVYLLVGGHDYFELGVLGDLLLDFEFQCYGKVRIFECVFL